MLSATPCCCREQASGGGGGNRTPVRKSPDAAFSERSHRFKFPLSPGSLWPDPGQSSFINSHRLQSLVRLVACMMTPLALYAGLEATTGSLKRLPERNCRSDLVFLSGCYAVPNSRGSLATPQTSPSKPVRPHGCTSRPFSRQLIIPQ